MPKLIIKGYTDSFFHYEHHPGIEDKKLIYSFAIFSTPRDYKVTIILEPVKKELGK